MERLVGLHGLTLHDLKILDLGCGYNAPVVILLQPRTALSVGLDLLPFYRSSFWRVARCLPAKMRVTGSLKAARLRLHTRLYHRELERVSGVRIRSTPANLVGFDGYGFPFAEGAFDCVVSNAVVQQIAVNIDDWAAEVARVLVPDGAIDLAWHNYFSWSGNFLSKEINRRHPWGHLTGETVAWGRLSKFSPADVVRAFTPYFDDIRLIPRDKKHRLRGIHRDFEWEAEGLLTATIAERLAHVPREWLLSRGYVLHARRKVCRGQTPSL